MRVVALGYWPYYRLRYEQGREGELYREKERLERELEEFQDRQRHEEWQREQAADIEFARRRQKREEQAYEREYMWENINNLEGEVEYLKLCRRFGIEEGEP